MNVSGQHMTTNFITKTSRTLHINNMTDLQITEICQSQRFINHIKIDTMLIPTDDCQTNAIDCNRCTRFQPLIAAGWQSNLETTNSAVILNLSDLTQALNNPCEH